jgi:hypothetical protein
MNKIFTCTNDTIAMDLVREGFEENELNEKFDTIVEELTEDRDVITISGNYIFGEVTAAYLKMQHNITCVTKQIA